MRDSYAAGDIGARPDTVIYGATMSAWDRSRREEAANRDVALLDDMEDIQNSGNRDIGPSRVAYNSALNALSKSGTKKYARRDESLLRSIK